MSRREEVEATWDHWGCTKTVNEIASLALEQVKSLADEVDAERAIVTKLLEMLEPSGGAMSSLEIAKDELYSHACEIAGRVK